MNPDLQLILSLDHRIPIEGEVFPAAASNLLFVWKPLGGEFAARWVPMIPVVLGMIAVAIAVLRLARELIDALRGAPGARPWRLLVLEAILTALGIGLFLVPFWSTILPAIRAPFGSPFTLLFFLFPIPLTALILLGLLSIRVFFVFGWMDEESPGWLFIRGRQRGLMLFGVAVIAIYALPVLLVLAMPRPSEVRVLDAASGEERARYRLSRESVWQVSARGQYVATRGMFFTTIRDGATFQPLVEMHHLPQADVLFSPEGTYALYERGSELGVYSLADGNVTWSKPGEWQLEEPWHPVAYRYYWGPDARSLYRYQVVSQDYHTVKQRVYRVAAREPVVSDGTFVEIPFSDGLDELVPLRRGQFILATHGTKKPVEHWTVLSTRTSAPAAEGGFARGAPLDNLNGPYFLVSRERALARNSGQPMPVRGFTGDTATHVAWGLERRMFAWDERELRVYRYRLDGLEN